MAEAAADHVEYAFGFDHDLGADTIARQENQLRIHEELSFAEGAEVRLGHVKLVGIRGTFRRPAAVRKWDCIVQQLQAVFESRLIPKKRNPGWHGSSPPGEAPIQ